jgi:hypothetical protein
MSGAEARPTTQPPAIGDRALNIQPPAWAGGSDVIEEDPDE